MENNTPIFDKTIFEKELKIAKIALKEKDLKEKIKKDEIFKNLNSYVKELETIVQSHTKDFKIHINGKFLHDVKLNRYSLKFKTVYNFKSKTFRILKFENDNLYKVTFCNGSGYHEPNEIFQYILNYYKLS